MRNFSLKLSILLVVFSCSKDDAVFADQNLMGSVGGLPFELRDGEAAEQVSSRKVSVRLYDVEETRVTCDLEESTSSTVSFAILPEVGITEFTRLGNAEVIVTFLPRKGMLDDPVSALEGVIEITEVTANSISGRLKVSADEFNTVDGNFSAVFCP